MRQRIIYVWLPRLATDRISRTNTKLHDEPLAVIANTHQGCCLHAINNTAQAAGVTPGMMLTAARTICPKLIVRPLNMRADQKAIKAIAQWCRSFTPLIARDSTHGLFLDITGCTHLFNGEQDMLCTLSSKLANLNLNAFTALADTPGAAWALAHFSPGQTIAPPRKTAQTIASLPVAGLRIGVETSDMLNRLGLKKIENLYGLPRASLTARFGANLVCRLDQALGTAPEPLEFDVKDKPYRTSLHFQDPINLVRDVETVLDHLLEKLCTQLETDGLGARKFLLTLTHVDNTTVQLEVGTVAPNRIPFDLKRLFQDRLETLDAGFGIERITLHATTVQAINAHQIIFTQDSKNTSNERAALIDRLTNRLGLGNLRAYAPAESHIPERAYKICAPSANHKSQRAFSPQNMSRPLRLYERPLPIQFEKPNRSNTKTMRILGRTHTIHKTTGPERIAREWWHEDPIWTEDLREYWWITNGEGQQFWVFKQHSKSGNNQWFLHGISA